MRILALLIVAAGMLAATGPSQAQAWNPNYPFCLQVYGPVNFNECRYYSMAQCAVAAQARAAQCVPNPYFAGNDEPPARSYPRQRRAY